MGAPMRSGRSRVRRLVIVTGLLVWGLSTQPHGAVGRHAAVDFTGDGKADFAVVRNTGGGAAGAVTWFVTRNGRVAPQAPVDFNGNGMSDLVVVRNTGGGPSGAVTWFEADSHVPFIDDALTAGVTRILAAHITELRTRIDALRNREGLAAFSWTTPTLGVGTTLIGRQYILDLRTALAAVYVAAQLTPPTYTNTTLTAGTSTVKAIDLQELRNAVAAIE
jgi:hypothetical protein